MRGQKLISALIIVVLFLWLAQTYFWHTQNQHLQSIHNKVYSRFIGGENHDGKKEKEKTKVEKYHFIEITAIALIVIAALLILITFKRRSKYWVSMFSNFFLIIVFLVAALSGVMLIYEYKIKGLDIKFWHVIFSLILLFTIVFHIIVHWKTWVTYFKKILRIKTAT